MNHPVIASSNANARHKQMIYEAANARRVKVLQSGKSKPSFFARLFGKKTSRPEAAKRLEPQTEGGAW